MSSELVIIGCKDRLETVRVIDEIVRANPNRFATRSDFVRESLRRFLKEWSSAEKRSAEAPINRETPRESIDELIDECFAVNRKPTRSEKNSEALIPQGIEPLVLYALAHVPFEVYKFQRVNMK